MLKTTSLILTIALSLATPLKDAVALDDANAVINNFLKDTLSDKITWNGKKDTKINKGFINIYDVAHAEVDPETGKRPHAVNIVLSEKPKGLDLSFNRSKKKEINKHIGKFYTEEWDLQKDVVAQLIKQIITYEADYDDEDNTLYFNTLQDVKNRIQDTIASDKDLRLTIELVGQTYGIEIYNKESLLASMTINVANEVNKKAGGEDEEADEKSRKVKKEAETKVYVMNISFMLSKEDAEEHNFKIPMITRNGNAFEAVMVDILAFLDFKEYFNNNEENYGVIEKFFNETKDFKFVPGEDAADSEGNPVKNFSLNFENYKVDGLIQYVPRNKLLSPAYYTLKLFSDGSLIKELSYRRMKFPDLRKLLESLNLRDLFKSVMEDIFGIFRDKYEENYGKKVGKSQFPVKSSNPLIGTPTHTIEARYDNLAIAMLEYSEKNGRVDLKIKTLKGLEVDFKYQFIKKQFKKNIIADVIGFLMKSGAQKYVQKEVL